MSMPAARVTDMHVCPMVTVLVPHVGGPILPPCAVTVLTGMLPQARLGDMALCVGPPDVIVLGAFTVLVSGQPAARIGDMTAHGGVITLGLPTVLIGDNGAGGGGGGGGAAMPGMGGPAAAAGVAEKAKGGTTDTSKDITVKSYSNGIKIEGDEAFQKQVAADLDAIKKTPSGKKLLEDIDKSGKTVTIKKTDKGNSVTGFDSGAMKKDGKNGKGSNSTVNYNPDRKKIGDEPWETRPPAIGLAHELVHAQHATEGSIDTTKVQNDSKPDPADPKKFAQEMQEEVRTVGIPPHDKDPYSENKIRSEWDPKQPERKWY